MAAGNRVAEALGYRATLIPQWDELTARLEGGARPQHDIAAVVPTSIDMNKVLATEQTIDAVSDGRLPPQEAQSAFAKIAALPPVSLGRFISAAAVGASALSVVFGAEHLLSIALIALSAGTGAAIRRRVSRLSPNPLLQPFCAALLAGLVGGLAQRYQLSSSQLLIALCPCMVLVPGPHFLNGLMDLVHARVALGASRIAFATLAIVAISTGLLLGLWLVGATLPIAPPSQSVPLVVDVIAAGLAVSASTGASVYAATFLACLFVGLVITPLANRLRLPFAAMAFAAVVSLIPGVFLFRMAAGLVQIAKLGMNAPISLTHVVLAEGSIALLILLAMGLGLMAPKLWAESFRPIGASTTTLTTGSNRVRKA